MTNAPISHPARILKKSDSTNPTRASAITQRRSTAESGDRGTRLCQKVCSPQSKVNRVLRSAPKSLASERWGSFSQPMSLTKSLCHTKGSTQKADRSPQTSSTPTRQRKVLMAGRRTPASTGDRKRVVWGKRVDVRVTRAGHRKKKQKK